MGRKRRDETQEDTQLTERMLLIADRIWKGNQAQMAKDLGVSPPVISRVLTGKQQPTGKLLAALLSRHPEVNLHWLLTGQGQPLLDSSAPAGGGRFRPVVDDLLPGPPAEHSERLSGLGYPVADTFYSTTSYWYRVPPAAPMVTSSEKVATGDLMLIETDEKWTRRWGAVLGKFCVFRLGRGRRERILLGKVAATGNEYIEEYERFRVNLFGESGDTWLLVADTAAGAEEGRKAVSGICLVMEQVAGVCMLLERPFERRRPADRVREEAGSD